jgi:hypothetical protein
MIRKYCDICDSEIISLSQLPTEDIRFTDYITGKEYKMFLCRHCYNRMCRIIKKSSRAERKAELKAIKNFNRLLRFDITGDA